MNINTHLHVDTDWPGSTRKMIRKPLKYATSLQTMMHLQRVLSSFIRNMVIMEFFRHLREKDFASEYELLIIAE